MATVLLTSARVVLRDTVTQPTSISIREGKIDKIGDAALTSAELALDCSSLTIFPGFIDVHIHGSVGVDVMAATVEGLSKVSRFLVSQGVTSWMPTLVPAANHEYEHAIQTIDEAAKGRRSGARIVGVHYEGPFVNSAQCGALHATHFRTFQGPNDIESLPVPAGPTVKMMTLAPEIDGGVELVKELRKRDWVVSIGHTRAETQVLDQAFAAGARHMTHFMNAMPQMHHRTPGPVGWGLSRDDVSCDVVADGVHLDPFILRLLVKVKRPKSLCLISDAIAAAGKGDGEYQIWGETISVKNGRTSNASGNIAGSVITMHDAVRMMRSLGVSDVEVGQLASQNPARLLRLDDECGSIQEGKRADLVALDQDGNVRLTMVGGEVVYESNLDVDY